MGEIATFIVVTMVMIASLRTVWRSWRDHLRLRRLLRRLSPEQIRRGATPRPPSRPLIFRSRLGWVRGILLCLVMAILSALMLLSVVLLWWVQKNLALLLLAIALLAACIWAVLRDVGDRWRSPGTRSSFSRSFPWKVWAALSIGCIP